MFQHTLSLVHTASDYDDIVLQNGWSPLGSASGGGHLAVVKTLIEAGAYVMQCDKVDRYTHIFSVL